ncbi:MAG: ATP-binding cassette domain-containing protein [Chloroflexota bacterium]
MIVKLENVTKNFTVGDDTIEVLRGIDLEIAAGELVAIVGPSGNGKSTLLNMITGIDHPTSGSVVVNGRSLPNLTEKRTGSLARGEALGIVFQFFRTAACPGLLQNVMLPMDFARTPTPAQRRERGLYLLEMVGWPTRHKLPGAVSGGQQRAAIARALANDPPSSSPTSQRAT